MSDPSTALSRDLVRARKALKDALPREERLLVERAGALRDIYSKYKLCAFDSDRKSESFESALKTLQQAIRYEAAKLDHVIERLHSSGLPDVQNLSQEIGEYQKMMSEFAESLPNVNLGAKQHNDMFMMIYNFFGQRIKPHIEAEMREWAELVKEIESPTLQ